MKCYMQLSDSLFSSAMPLSCEMNGGSIIFIDLHKTYKDLEQGQLILDLYLIASLEFAPRFLLEFFSVLKY